MELNKKVFPIHARYISYGAHIADGLLQSHVSLAHGAHIADGLLQSHVSLAHGAHIADGLLQSHVSLAHGAHIADGLLQSHASLAMRLRITGTDEQHRASNGPSRVQFMKSNLILHLCLQVLFRGLTSS